MKKIVLTLFVLSIGIVYGQFASAEKQKASTNMGAEEGHSAKVQREAMKADLQDEKSAIVAACAEEAKTAGCGDKSVGRGFLKCIHEHKKASKDFKISDGCKASMKALKEERKKIKAQTNKEK